VRPGSVAALLDCLGEINDVSEIFRRLTNLRFQF
jgi:hypothetical protein